MLSLSTGLSLTSNILGAVAVPSLSLPINDVAPVISGTSFVGETLTRTEGVWSDADTVTGQWKRDGVDISGETGATYTLVLADDETAITYVETATNTDGSATESSNAIDVGPPADLAFDPATLSNCTLHLDFADDTTFTISDGRVTAVADKSPLAASYAQETVSRQPQVSATKMAGRNVLDFDGGALTTSAPPLIRQVYIVWREIRGGDKDGGDNLDLLPLIGHSVDHDRYTYMDETDLTVDISTEGEANVAGSANANGGAINVGGGAASKNLDIPGIDATNRMSANEIGILYYSDYNVKHIGKFVTNSGSWYLDADMAEVVGYSVAPSLEDRQKIEGYLCHKWGLEAKMPVDHPYKSAPPTATPVLTPGSNSAVTYPAAGVSFNFVASDGTTEEDLTTGKFANNDWYVVRPDPDPVRIGSIDPAYIEETDVDNGRTGGTTTTGKRQRNGAMVNPTQLRETGGEPQFDNWNLFQVSGDENMSGVGQVDPGETGVLYAATGEETIVKAVGSTTTPSDSNTRGNIARYALLTVVDSAPAAGSFRPPVAATSKTIQANKSDIDYTVLKSLDISGAVGSSFASIENDFLQRQPFQTWSTREESSRKDVAELQWPNYGRDQAYIFGTAMLYLHDNQTDAVKEPLAIAVCQMALDILAAAKAGAQWGPDGGHELGRKGILAMGAALLNGTTVGDEMADYCDPALHPNIFSEDNQYFEVDAADVALTLQNDSNGRSAPIEYQNAHIGWPEWGLRASTTPARSSANLSAAYRGIGMSTLGATLAAHMCDGGPAIFNNDITMQAQDRFRGADAGGFVFSQQYSQDHLAVWDAYRSAQTTLAVWTGNPEMPLPPTVAQAGTGELTVTRETAENANGSAITRRDLRYSTDGTTWTEVTDVFDGTNVHTLTGLTSSTEYFIQVRDVNGAALNSGVGPWSTNNVATVGSTTQQAVGTPT